MKRILSVLLILFLLTGCGGTAHELERAVAMRGKILSAENCTFGAVVTADYGDKVYKFQMDCRTDKNGTVFFEILSPETIMGITGNISEETGRLTFDDKVLLFELLVDGQITPVSAPWLLMQTLRSGYIKGCDDSDGGIYIQINDSYSEDALHVDVWTDENDRPIRAEFLWDGRRVVSIDVENFTFL